MPANRLNPKDLAHFCDGILKLWNIDLRSYAQRQLHRRLRGMMARVGARNLRDFLKRLKNDPELSEQFKNHFTINVSEFFRDTHLFAKLEEMLKPSGACHGAKKIWSAGCSYGAEPYSLAILMHEHSPRGNWQILATDIDQEALQQAREGIFSERDLRNVSTTRQLRYFDPVGPDSYAISDELKRRIKFSTCDLLQPHGHQPRYCDIVLCRNVIIYFTTEAKSKVHRLLVEALRPGGVLLIGATERMPDAGDLGLETISPFFYQKSAAA